MLDSDINTNGLKVRLLQRIIARIDEEIASMSRAAQAAHEAATHAESRSEDKHDTRGLEASYLAGAQAARVEELQRVVAKLRETPTRPFSKSEAITPGALIEAEVDGQSHLFFLITDGAAGLSLEEDGKRVQVITARSPMGQALIGRYRGESTEVEVGKHLTEVEIVSVR